MAIRFCQLKTGCNLLFLVVTVVFGLEVPGARAADLSFSGQCPILYAQANQFAQACLVNATEYQRYFNGDPEVYYAYIGPSSADSHFGLACTLNSQHAISFLGVYFTMDPANFALARGVQPAYVDFDGNIGFVLKEQPVYFFAVRSFKAQFRTITYYPPSSYNCDTTANKAGYVADNWGGGSFVFERFVKNMILIKACFSTDACEAELEFIPLINDVSWSDKSFVYASRGLDYFILNDGQLLWNKNELISYCPVFFKPIKDPKNLSYPPVSDLRESCLAAKNKLLYK